MPAGNPEDDWTISSAFTARNELLANFAKRLARAAVQAFVRGCRCMLNALTHQAESFLAAVPRMTVRRRNDETVASRRNAHKAGISNPAPMLTAQGFVTLRFFRSGFLARLDCNTLEKIRAAGTILAQKEKARHQAGLSQNS